MALATEAGEAEKVFTFHFSLRFMFEMSEDGCVGDNGTDRAAALIRLPVASFLRNRVC